ncbi:MAG: hypothetical protein GY702_15840 [Desulfobulbaceae bacterium]|nr:hypothetical protein [Desulfobulbaceae bacterium]
MKPDNSQVMQTEQMKSTITSLCLSGHFATLYRILKDLPGSMSILSSDQTAEQKRRQLLKLVKEKR